MNTLSPDQWSKVRQLLGTWLANPDADIEGAVAWCERYVETLPYQMDTAAVTAPWAVAGVYRRKHPSKMNRWTLTLSGYRETRRTPWR